MSELNPVKKPWERPENWVTGFFTLGLLALGLVGLHELLPYLNDILMSLWKTIFLGAGVGAVLFVAMSKDIHKLGWVGWRILMKKITQAFVDIDPIVIMEGYREDCDSNIEDITSSIGSLVGQEKKMVKKIEDAHKGIEESMERASFAKKKLGEEGMKAQLAISINKAGMLEESSVTYQGLLNDLRTHIAIAKKMKESAVFIRAKIDNTITIEKDKRDAIRDSYKVMVSARRIIQGNAQRELYDMAAESLAKDFYSKMGEIQQFMDDSKEIILTMDLDKGIVEEKTLAKLKEWEKRAESLMGGDSPKLRVSGEEGADAGPVEEGGTEEEPKRQSFAGLFKDLEKMK
jgi:hypothetical protein